MGYAERANPRNTRQGREIMAMLALFPDRTTYEQWLTAREVADDVRAHLEQFLPARLLTKWTV
jgi:uncharacterized NAD(P)/FAD-binding protein YdhS